MPAIDVSSDQAVANFRQRVEELYEFVTGWVTIWSPRSQVTRRRITLHEAATGPYEMEALDIKDPDMGRVVTLRPVACYLAGADGRVDIESSVSRETLLYLADGEPSLVMHVQRGDSDWIPSPPAGAHPPETAPGWLWMQNRLLSLSPSLNNELLFRFIEVLGR